jgi:hypothetical protein
MAAPWVVTCSCGWTREFSRRWAAESAVQRHPRLGEPPLRGAAAREPTHKQASWTV